mgnify:CR=1 FL=1
MGAHFMFKNIKPPTTYSQQVKLLQGRNVLVSNVSECEIFLSRVNYYRFTGYLLPFVDRPSDHCDPPVEFDRIVQIYSFDAELRNLIAHATEKIEIYIRTQLAYRSAHQYGALGYMNAQNYNKHHDHVKFLGLINKAISDNRNSPVVRHHIAVYGGNFPIWVIIDYFSLGMLSKFYADLPNRDKSHIAHDLYGVNYQTLSSWLRCLTDLRNRCAHYSRLYYWTFPALPVLPVTSPFSPDRRLFTQLFMLKLLYPEPDNWNKDFMDPLAKIMSKYKNSICKEHIGFPYRWRSILSR